MKPRALPQDAALHRALGQAVRRFTVREIVLRYLPRPSTVRWVATALIDHHRVSDKLRADIGDGSLTFAQIERFQDAPVARGEGATALAAVKAMLPVTWRAPR